jgi:hypothetical protein
LEYNLKIGPQGHVYLPKLIRESFGDKMKFVPDALSGVIYPENAKREDVIESLEIIIQHLKLEQRKEDNKQHSEEGTST